MMLFRSLRHRNFAFLWTGQTISRLGDSLYRIALAWWVLEKTGSATDMGAVLIFSTAPSLIFVMLGGVAVDRLSRPLVMLVSDLLRGLTVAAVTGLMLAGRLEIGHIFAASVLFGVVDAFFQPAYNAIVPGITPAEALPSANSLTSLSGQLSGIAGPALGAAIVHFGGTSLAFALDGVSFFASALCLVPLLKVANPPLSAAPLPGRTGLLHDLRDGIRLVLASPWLWITIAIASLGNVTSSGPFIVALPFLVRENLHLDVGALGLIYSLFSAGMVVGTVWVGHRGRIQRRGKTAYMAWFVGGVMIFIFGLSLGLPIIAAAAAVSGICAAIFSLIWTNTVQELVPPEMLGRVSSIDYLGSYVLLPVGYGVAGWATDLLGAPAVFLIGGGVTALLIGLGLAHPAIRGLD